MKRVFRLFVPLAALVALAAIIAPLALAGGNSSNAQACQESGWQNLVRQDGTTFTNTGDCVSYAAKGGVLTLKSTGGSENFSEDTVGSQPTTFSGGTIDSPYGASPASAPWFPAGGVLAAGPYFNGFASGSHFLFTGLGVNTVKFTFTNPAKSVQVQVESDKTGISPTLTLTGYDASGHAIPGATATDTHPSTGVDSATMNITSSSSNIKSFVLTNDDGGNNAGLGISNIVWS